MLFKFLADRLKSENPPQTSELIKLLEFGHSINHSAFTFVKELQYKSYGAIITDSSQNKAKILDYLRENESFEFEYLNSNLISDLDSFNNTEVYVGKFEPNYEKLTDYCRDNGVMIFFLSYRCCFDQY